MEIINELARRIFTWKGKPITFSFIVLYSFRKLPRYTQRPMTYVDALHDVFNLMPTNVCMEG